MTGTQHILAPSPHSCLHSSGSTPRLSRQPPLARMKNFSEVTVEIRRFQTERSQHIFTARLCLQYAVCNPSCHVIHLTTSCPHNCVCYSWPFQPPSAKRQFFWVLFIMSQMPFSSISKAVDYVGHLINESSGNFPFSLHNQNYTLLPIARLIYIHST